MHLHLPRQKPLAQHLNQIISGNPDEAVPADAVHIRGPAQATSHTLFTATFHFPNEDVDRICPIRPVSPNCFFQLIGIVILQNVE